MDLRILDYLKLYGQKWPSALHDNAPTLWGMRKIKSSGKIRCGKQTDEN